MARSPSSRKHPTTTEAPVFFDAVINVLGYREAGQWVALALDMDLRGYGPTFDAARSDLLELIIMQIGFARFKNQSELIWHPAEPKYFEVFQTARSEKLRLMARSSQPKRAEFMTGAFPMPVVPSLSFALANG